jgi:hypothetical protein
MKNIIRTAFVAGAVLVGALVFAQVQVIPPGSGGGSSGSVTGGTCTNKVATAIASSTAVPTCTTVTSSYVDTSIGLTGSSLAQFASTTLAQLSTLLGTTGSASSSTYLRGDNSWATVSSGSFVLVEEHTASSSADLEFTTGITSTYDDYIVRLINVNPATTSTTLEMQVSTNSGSTWVADGNYYGAVLGYDNGGAAQSYHPAAINFYQLTPTTDTSTGFDGISGDIDVTNPGSASLRKSITFNITMPASASFIRFAGSAVWTGTTAVNAVRFLFSSGNVASGTIRMYGLTH